MACAENGRVVHFLLLRVEKVLTWKEESLSQLIILQNGQKDHFARTVGLIFFTSAGLFKESADFKFKAQIYIDAKPACYEFSNKTETMTEAEVMAKFAPN